MKAELDETGTLVISPETALESFALSHWHTSWSRRQASLHIVILERVNPMRPMLALVEPPLTRPGGLDEAG